MVGDLIDKEGASGRRSFTLKYIDSDILFSSLIYFHEFLCLLLTFLLTIFLIFIKI